MMQPSSGSLTILCWGLEQHVDNILHPYSVCIDGYKAVSLRVIPVVTTSTIYVALQLACGPGQRCM